MKWIAKLLPLMMASTLLLAPAGASAYYNGFWYTNYSTQAPVNHPAPTSPSTKAATGTSGTSANDLTPVEQSLLRLLNQDRVKNGLAPVQADSTLTSLARRKSSDMVAKGYFSHTSPTYGTPAQMLARFGVSYNQYAENIAQGASAEQIESMWMNSPGHRANILNPHLNRVGIGVAAGGVSGYTATQLFIAR